MQQGAGIEQAWSPVCSALCSSLLTRMCNIRRPSRSGTSRCNQTLFRGINFTPMDLKWPTSHPHVIVDQAAGIWSNRDDCYIPGVGVGVVEAMLQQLHRVK